MFQNAEAMGPQVIVANMAFHWFHLCGYSEKMCPSSMDATIILRWLEYRMTWLQRMYDFALMVNAKLLLFKTANFICGEARTGDWATGDTLYQSFDNVTISNCKKRLWPFGKDLFVGNDHSMDDILKYCKYGQFTDVGSRYLNSEMVDFVNEVQDDALSSGLVVGLYNDYGVETCSTTDDGIHHKSAITLRMRLLSNTIDSYMKCSTTT